MTIKNVTRAYSNKNLRLPNFDHKFEIYDKITFFKIIIVRRNIMPCHI